MLNGSKQIMKDRARAQRLRRLGQLARHPRHMLRLQQMRRSQSPSGYSLQQFESSRSIFIHIPKAAGVSVANALYGNRGCGHLAMREYELAFSHRFLHECFTFTFVRNPWDRLHSAFHFLAKGGMNSSDSQWAAENARNLRSFEGFVLEGLQYPAIAEMLHIVPQVRFLYSPVNGYGAIDFIGLFENLTNDFRTICAAIGRAGVSLPHENRTAGGRGDYRSAYTDTMREAAGKFYREDVALLGYDFEGLDIDRQLAQRVTSSASKS